MNSLYHDKHRENGVSTVQIAVEIAPSTAASPNCMSICF